MLLRYRFRVYPTQPQRAALSRLFGCVRVVYNDAITARRAAHADGSPYPTAAALDKLLITTAKQTPERAWLAEVSSVPLQQALRDCHAAYRNFFESLSGKRAGPRIGLPRFKRRSSTQTARFTRNAGFRVDSGGRLRLPKIGAVKVAWSRELPSDPSSVTLIKTSSGKYFASFVVSLNDDAEILEPIAGPEAETGVDLGLKDFAVIRGGRTIESPKFFRSMERKLKKAQRAVARKQKGSRNWQKARMTVARVHERIRYRRDDWLNKQVIGLVRENQAVYVEDLHVAGLARGRHAKSIHDAAFGMFLARLESKATRAGREFVRVDRYFPSTQLCSACGALTGPKGLAGLGTRTWSCGCGAAHDRDVNAELNIRREGRRLLEQRLVAAGYAETRNAPGGRVRPGIPGTSRNTRKGQNGEPNRTGAPVTAP